MSERQRVKAILRHRGKDDPLYKYVAELEKRACMKKSVRVGKLKEKIKKLEGENRYLNNVLGRVKAYMKDML